MDAIQNKNEEYSVPSFIPPIIKNHFITRLSLVALVYTLQGATLEFLQQAVQTELILNGATLSQLAIMSTMEFPWCFKFLWGPFQDAFFIPYVGRRKTWVMGTMISLGILWAILGSKIQNMISTLDVNSLALVGIISSIFITSQDVSMDGWIVKLSKDEEEMSKFSWWSSFGYSLGGLFSFSFYIWLSNDRLCHQLFSRSHVINSKQLVIFLCITLFIVLFLVGLMIEDKDSMEMPELHDTQQSSENSNQNSTEPQSISQLANFRKVITKLAQLFRNPNFIYLAIYLLFSEVGFSYFDSVGYVVMLDRGVSGDMVAFYWLLSTICEGIAGYVVASYCAGRQMKIYLGSFILRTFNCGFYSLIIYILNKNQLKYSTIVTLFGFQQCINEIGLAMQTVSLLSFFLSVCDSEVEGSFLAILSSVIHSATILTATTMYALSDVIDPAPLIIFSMLYDVIYFCVFFRWVLKLQDLPKGEWAPKKVVIQVSETEIQAIKPQENVSSFEFDVVKKDEKYDQQIYAVYDY